ncbi:MAG: RibD family protein, partial [Myxococcota bacterium]
PLPPPARRRALERVGVRVLLTPDREGRLDLRRALRRLAREGLTEILVEGGGELGASLLRAGVVDEVHWFTAPILLGGEGRAALAALPMAALADAPRLDPVQVRRLGRDVHVVGRIPRRKRGGR